MRGVVTTFNLDHFVCAGKQQTDLNALITARNPEVIMVQEAQNLNLRKYIPVTYDTNQVMETEELRRVAIIWKKSTFDEVKTVGIEGRDSTRYTSRITLSNKADGRKTRFLAVKMPPDQAGQSTMASRLVEIYASNKLDNFVMAGDFQYPLVSDDYGIARRTKLSMRIYKKEGFFIPSLLNPSSGTTGPRSNSDHLPVNLTLDL